VTVNPETSRDSDLASALKSPLDYTALPLVAHWDTVEASKEPGKKQVRYVLAVAPDPALIDVADNNHVVLDGVAMAKTPEGKPVGQPVGRRIDLHSTSEQLAAFGEKGLSCRGALELAPGEYTVRIVVRGGLSGLSGRIGSIAAPLKVE
jgi:hypothetical protein